MKPFYAQNRKISGAPMFGSTHIVYEVNELFHKICEGATRDFTSSKVNVRYEIYQVARVRV